MGNLLLVNYIKVYIDKEIISIELISSPFTHKMAVDINEFIIKHNNTLCKIQIILSNYM